MGFRGFIFFDEPSSFDFRVAARDKIFDDSFEKLTGFTHLVIYHTCRLVAVTHHYFTFDSLLGFIVWSIAGSIFCAVLLAYYEQERSYNHEQNEAQKKRILQATVKCSLVWGLIIGLIWFMYHSNTP